MNLLAFKGFSMVCQPSKIFFVVLRGSPRGAQPPFRNYKKIFVFVVGVVLVVLKLVVSWYPS
jgi:hypothetical protein